jgi:phosphotriesterase-related protein
MDDEDLRILKILIYIIIFLLFGIIIITCSRVPEDMIMTVSGKIPASEMGKTLEHEHVLVDFIGADSTGYFRWDKEEVIEKALPFIMAAKEKGLETFIECTPAYLGRDPLLLKELSEKSGVKFITNTGYYGARSNLFLPQSFDVSDASQIAEFWIKEFENGIEETGVRPGFIKIGVDPDDSLSAEHLKIIKAAAIAHLKTGLQSASHTGPDNPAFEQIKVLKSNGVDPSAFIWVHAQNGSIEGNIEAAREGAWISLDNVRPGTGRDNTGQGNINWYCNRIVELKKEGLLNKVLISHDSGWYDPAKPEGGEYNGYTIIFDSLLPALRTSGLTENEINQIIVKNPREAFKIKIRRYE